MRFIKYLLILVLVLSIGQAWAIDNHIIFETTNEYDGNLGGRIGANEICMTEAESLGLNGEFIAYLDYSDGGTIGLLNRDILYETPLGAISIGAAINAPFTAFEGSYWYGSSGSGGISGSCEDFSINAVNVNGRLYVNDGTSLTSETEDCSNTNKLLCVTLKSCGNGLIEEGEECDPGINYNYFGFDFSGDKVCSPICEKICTETDSGEEYDNRGVTYGWTVEGSAVFNSDVCEDQLLNEFYCTDDEILHTTYPIHDCAAEGNFCVNGACISPDCGDSIIQGGEECDDGNTVTENCTYGQTTCDVCASDCKNREGNTFYCSDSVVSDQEICDDGNNINETACDYGTANCIFCKSDCSANLTLTGQYCGDNILNLTNNEECDDGNNITSDGCNELCQNETVFALKVHLFDYAKNLVTSIKNIGYAIFETTVSNLDSAEETVDAYVYSGKSIPAGIVGHNVYCDMQGVLCCVMNDGDYCKDYYVTETGGNYLGSHCACNNTESNFNEKMPWMSVYPDSFEKVTLKKSESDYKLLSDEKEYRYSDCKRVGDNSVCYIKAYFEDPEGNIFEDLYTLNVNRDSTSKPLINYTVAGDPETSKDIYYIDVETFETANENEESYPVVFDASLSRFKSPTCYGGEECYFIDNNFLEYKWYIEIHNKPWGVVDNFLCTNGTDSCVNPICESQCQAESPCTCLQFDEDGEVYDGYVDNRKIFTYNFANSDVCGPEKSCAVTLIVTDKTTLASDTKQFGIVLSGSVSGDSPYGNYSQLCKYGGEQISYTGYCCKNGYMVNPVFNNFNELFKNRINACIDVPNEGPVAKISFPENNEEYKAGANEEVYFRAEGTDSDGNITGYLWDFGDRSKPWGYLATNEFDEIICKKDGKRKSCDEDEAVALDDYEQDEQIPCSCDVEYSEDILNIYPESISTKEKTVHEYDDIYVCTEYDEEQETECTITLWVFDNEGSSSKSKITIDLVTEVSGGDIDYDSPDFYCGDGLITGAEECDIDDALDCETGECASDCTCAKESDLDSIKLIDPSKDRDDDTVCGNSICEFGENSETCLTDCHCGDGICQDSMENENTCSSDCKSSGGSTTVILLVIILAAVGIIFLLYKQGFDFTRITSLFKDFKFPTKSNTPDVESKFPEIPSSKNPDSSLENYIRSTRKSGFSYSQIKDTLEKKGWKEDKINEIFRRVGLP
jgi:cysteine-rich repeat protein